MGDDVSGSGFDPCECIWDHEMAMRRLLNILRNSQNLCTDAECFEPGPGAPGSVQTENFYFFSIAIGIALLLYFFRPRLQANDSLKPDNGNNSNNTPPAPPIN
ncbi:hypothetical protein ABEB36_011626 [Hypothenemus hampei]|uniref:Small integral membrane protein 14 n=1 Tax=Hypothenemus hampei TaxID=57062 RepID=A0ABD1E8H8_HYPHA